MKTFLLIGQPPIKINGLEVDKQQRLFYGDLSRQLGTTLVYPRDAMHKTFCGTVVRANGRFTISVCKPDFPANFQNDNFPNLLFFKQSIDADTLRLISTNPDGGGQNLIANYHAVTSARGQQILNIKKIDFGGNENLWQHYSALSQHLFIQEFDNNYQVDPDNSHDLHVQTVTESLPNTEDIVWVNPVCLRLPLTGAELNTSQFDLWAENTQPLWLEPLFQQSQAPRIYFYQYGDEKIKARQSPYRSRMEQLIFGTPSRQNGYPHWQAFAALDVLQGQFFLNNQSHYCWQPPDKLSPNADYFANYWLARWHGKKASDSSVSKSHQIEPPSYTKTFRYAASSSGIPLDNNACQQRQTLFQCFSLLNKPVFKVIQAVLSHCPKEHVAHDLHRGYLTLHDNQDEHYALAFNAQAYLYEFALRYIAPVSQIMIELPSPDFVAEPALIELCQTQQAFYQKAIQNQHFNPIDSTFHGARGFFQQLCVSIETGLQVNDVTPVFKLGWWNHWHDYLYQNATQSQFGFDLSPKAEQQIRVGQAEVGDMTYVGGYTLYQQTQKMCF